jgi:Bacteriophage T4-like portal protein (Gp20)
MGWKKHWRIVSDGAYSPVNGSVSDYSSYNYLGSQANAAYRNYQSMLPDVYSGHPNRIDRYTQYENMDLDSEANSALDILAEFCTQISEDTKTPFNIFFHEEATENEIMILKEQIKAWTKLNDFDQRIFKMFRNTLKYGDQVFVRDPETYKWFWTEMNRVSKVIVNESQGKVPEIYYIRDLNPNLQNSTITRPPGPNDTYAFAPYMGGSRSYTAGGELFSPNTRFGAGNNEFPVAAEHIVHLSLTEGLDVSWPFGVSLFEAIFKVFKQKELLEDAILIYRISRAPERRMFKIDVGNMPAHLAMQFVERVKNEINQRRIPTQSGGGSNLMDASYNPMSMNEDFFFPQSAEGRGSSVEVLPGGQNLGEIDDLRYFQNKMYRSLRIPSSYLPTGPEDSDRAFTDGKVTTALIQEYRFNEYCKRLQKYISPKFDLEFKLYLKHKGFNLDNSLFELRFVEPQNFASYRENELNAGRITAFTQINQTEYLSKRFMLKKYLGLSDMEMAENEKLWHEERGSEEAQSKLQGSDLRSVGVTPGAIGGDLETISDIQAAQGGPGGGNIPPAVPGGEIGAGGVPSPTGGAGGGQGGSTAGAALGGA